MSGHGLTVYASGRQYKGEHKTASTNGLTYRHGKGIFSWPNGYTYNGKYRWGNRVKGTATKDGKR